jgi:hypothetical protein
LPQIAYLFEKDNKQTDEIIFGWGECYKYNEAGDGRESDRVGGGKPSLGKVSRKVI